MAEKLHISLLGEGVSVLEKVLRERAEEEERVRLAPARRRTFAEDVVKELNGRVDSCGEFRAP
ncbi:MAG: hypothetical protein AABY26_03475, partial [Nanoarchaeota archaeon]